MTQQSSDDLVDELRSQVDRINARQAENAELLGKLDSIQDQLADLEAKATSPDGTVTVVAGSGGIVRSVELTSTATNADAATLSASINAALQRAIADATRQQLELVRGNVGTDLDTERVLGPQAKFVDYGSRDTATPDESEPANDTAEFDEDEPFSVFDHR